MANLAAVNRPLTPEEQATLDARAALPSDYTRTPRQTMQQIARTLRENVDTYPALYLRVHRHSDGEFTVWISGDQIHAPLASTREPAILQCFKTAGAALNACAKITQLAGLERRPEIKVWL